MAAHALTDMTVGERIRPTIRPAIIDPLADPRWQDFVEGHPAALAFHGTRWIAALSHVFGYQCRFHVIEDSSRRIVAGWPAMLVKSRLTGNRLVCLPFCHCAGPLVSGFDQAEALLASLVLDAERLRIPSIEVRDWPAGIEVPPELSQINPFRRHVLDLAGQTEGVWAGLSKDMRYSIRRAERNGVTVREATSPADLDAFYVMYQAQRRRQGLLPQPRRFLREIFEQMVPTGEGFLVMAEHEGRPVASLLSVNNARVAIGTHSAATPAARSLRAVPLAMWRSVELACQRGLVNYDLGRSDKGAAGLRHFKEEWGAAEVELPYLYYPHPHGLNSKAPSGLGKSMLDLYARVVPEPIFSALSSVMYRHLG